MQTKQDLEARYYSIQDELAAAPNWKMDTEWWTARIAELQSINRQLARP